MYIHVLVTYSAEPSIIRVMMHIVCTWYVQAVTGYKRVRTSFRRVCTIAFFPYTTENEGPKGRSDSDSQAACWKNECSFRSNKLEQACPAAAGPPAQPGSDPLVTSRPSPVLFRAEQAQAETQTQTTCTLIVQLEVVQLSSCTADCTHHLEGCAQYMISYMIS